MARERCDVDLDHLALSSGEARKLELRIALEPIELGGQTYEPEGGGVDAVLDVSRTTTGYALRLRFDAVLDGPCVRCLTESRLRARGRRPRGRPGRRRPTRSCAAPT